MKLVRNSIPALHPQHDYRPAAENEVGILFRLKVLEEAGEVAGARNRAELVEELGDLIDAVWALARVTDIEPGEIFQSRREKVARLGDFSNHTLMTEYRP